MILESELQEVEINNWHIKIKEPSVADRNPAILLLHGWSGDESAMWVFARAIPQNHFIIAPRGIFSTDIGGYGWLPGIDGWPQLNDYRQSIDAIVDLLEKLGRDYPNYDLNKIGVMGFSQGASLGYAFGVNYPQKIRYLIGLAGFMPDGVGEQVKNKILVDVPVFVAHGSKDELVPVARARQAVHLLKNSGANLTYCEEEVGHKLSASCYQGLVNYFNKLDLK